MELKLPFIMWLIQGIPESIAVVTLGLALLKKKFLLKKALIPGLLQAVILYLVRQFPLPPGFHTVLGLFSLSILFYYFTGINYSRALVLSFFVQTLLGWVEYLIVTPILYLTKVPVETIFARPLFGGMLGLPQVVVLFLLSLAAVRLQQGKGKNGDNTQIHGGKEVLEVCRRSFFTAPGWRKRREGS